MKVTIPRQWVYFKKQPRELPSKFARAVAFGDLAEHFVRAVDRALEHVGRCGSGVFRIAGQRRELPAGGCLRDFGDWRLVSQVEIDSGDGDEEEDDFHSLEMSMA